MFNAIIALEALLDFVAFFTNMYFVVLLTRNVFHINLRVILGGFSLTLAIIVFCRFPQLIIIVQTKRLWDAENGLFAVIHDAGMNVFAFVAVPLTIERVLATFLSRFYERRHRPWVGAGLWVILWVLAVAYATLSTYEFSTIDSSDTGVVNLHDEGRKQVMCIVFSTSLIAGVVSFLVFLALVRYNVSQYSGFQGSNKHTLAYRYQLAENVRTGKQLLPILMIVFAANIYFFFVVLAIVFEAITTELAAILSHVFDFLVSIVAIAIPLTAIWCHDQLRRLFIFHLLILLRRRRFSTVVPRTLNGDEMILSKEQERNKYFEALERSWS